MKTGYRTIVAAAMLLCAVGTASAADFSSWAKNMQIQFSGYTRSDALTNFPTLVVFSNGVASGFSYVDFLSTNADLRFTDSTQTNELNCEVEKWDTNGSSCVWVQVPLLTNNARLFAFWGKSGQTAPAYTTNGATWTNGYVGVWHLNEGGTGTRYNSTTNRYGATPTGFGGTEAVTGQVAGAVELNGTTKYLSVANQPVYDLGTGAGKQWTVSIWYQAKGSATTAQMLVMKRGATASTSTDYGLFTENGSLIWGTGAAADPARGAWFGVTEPARSNWHHVVGTLTATGTTSGVKSLFVDGVALVVNTNYTAKATTQASALIFGREPPSSSFFFNGILDEIRIENVARSSNWVWACYMNQASNGSFNTTYSVGTSPLPAVVNVGSQNLGETYGDVVGRLSTNGAAAATVSLYWGPVDGLNNASAWTAGGGSVRTIGAQADGATFTNTLTGLAPNATNYWNYSASNASGTVWAATAGSPYFKTLDPLARRTNYVDSA